MGSLVPMYKSWVWGYVSIIPGLRRRERKTPKVHWTATLAEMESSGFSERFYLKK